MLIDRKIPPLVVIVLLFMLFSFYVVAWTIPERDNERLSIRSQSPFEVYIKNKEPSNTYALPSNTSLKSKSNAFMIANHHSNMSSDTFSLPAQNNMATRLTFSYEGNEIKLVSKQNIEKVLPSPSSLQSHIQQNQTGSWYELSDENQHVLHRQIIDNPIKVDAEVFSDTTDSISRVKLSEIRGTFSIVVPNIPESKNFDLFSSPVISEGIKGLQKPTTKIFHLDLK